MLPGVSKVLTCTGTANQVSHAFRHLQEAGVNVEAAKSAILNDIVAKGALSEGLTTGTVNVGGRSLIYNAFKLADGTINVGRVTVKCSFSYKSAA